MAGRGGSKFDSPTVYQIPSAVDSAISFSIGDLNGDHKPDIAITLTPYFGDSGSVLTFWGNGDGTFQVGPSTTMPVKPGSIAIADLNGDGKPDFAISYSSDVAQSGIPVGTGIAVSMGKGDGTFQPASYIKAAGSSLAIGDLNGDGVPDIVTTGALLFGDGKGSFPSRQDYQVTEEGSVILTDFDGDGRIDVVIAGGTPGLVVGQVLSSGDTADETIAVLFAQPDGTFRGPAVSGAPGITPGVAGIYDFRTADFNGDGLPDLAYVAGFAGIGSMRGKGNGTFTSSFVSSPSTPDLEIAIATGDFNRDGNQDVVTLDYGDKSNVLEFSAGRGDGTFQLPITTPLPANSWRLVAGDFNGDSKMDIAVLIQAGGNGTSNEVTIFLGNGDGTFRQGATYQGGGLSIVTGDLNNDGKPDLVISGPNSITTLLGKGDGTFLQGTQVALDGPENMSLADFNGDGKVDLAAVLTVSNESAGFNVLLGKGDGTFKDPLFNSLAVGGLAVADLNFDGIPDLVVTGLPSYNYLLGNGDGSFQAPVSLNLPYADGPMLMVDLNRDGQPDLVSAAALLGGFFSLLNVGGGEPDFQVASSASFAIGPVAPNSFVTAFGTGLPTPRESLSITVTDSAGVPRQATALFSSATQLNFFMPPGISPGPAVVDIRVAINGPRAIGTAEIVPIAPGLFTENADALAAAYAVRVDAMGNQSFEPIFSVQNGQVVATPIEVGSPADQVFLCLFGTGFDAAAANTTTATVGGQPAQVTYAGSQEEAGLDQVNVLLPRSLAGRGDSLVVLSVDGAVTNAVHVTIQ